VSLNLNATSATPGDEYGYHRARHITVIQTQMEARTGMNLISLILKSLCSQNSTFTLESGKGAVPLSMLFTRLRRVAAIGVFATALLVAASS